MSNCTRRCLSFDEDVEEKFMRAREVHAAQVNRPGVMSTQIGDVS